MKIGKLAIWTITMSFSLSTVAQTSFDAAKLYEEELNGTARYVGMGGAMSAFGNDVSVISHNPAGIGTYSQSDMNVSASFFGSSVNSDPLVTRANPGFANGRTYYSKNNKSDMNMAFDNFSVVFSGSDAGDSYLNVGFAYRKLQNMDRNLDYIDSFDDADGYEVFREYKDHQRNKIHSFDFNLSCNLHDKLYLGWTVGVLSTDTWSEGYFYDYYAKGAHPEYPDGLDYTAVDKMNQAAGSGWNMAVGVIYRPINALRIGVAFKTPTLFKQRLTYSDNLYSFEGIVMDGDKFSNNVDYKFSSPWMVNLSAGLTIDRTAIGVEYERHYTQRTSLSISNSKMDNQGAIDYNDYSVFKVGAEQNIGKASMRLGYNYIQPIFKNNAAPYLSDSEFNAGADGELGRTDFQIDRLINTQYITAGLGYCSQPDIDGAQLYFDIAYIYGLRKSVVNVNEYIEDIDVKYGYKTSKVLFTIGCSF